MTISYAITVCNETDELKRLVTHLRKFMRAQDEIVILHDTTKSTPEIEDLLNIYNGFESVTITSGEFKGEFAEWKNKLTSLCSGNYIFQIDADEIPNEVLIEYLPAIIQENPNNEVYLVPRVNTVKGLTEEHIQKWGWNVDNKGWVNWPDYQWRIWMNKPEIKWKNKVHEVLIGYQEHTYLPAEEQFSFYHPKTIDRQEKQNKFYDTI